MTIPLPKGLDIGEKLALLGATPYGTITVDFPAYSDLGLRLLRAFFIVTTPSNWKDYTRLGNPISRSILMCRSSSFRPGPLVVANLDAALQGSRL